LKTHNNIFLHCLYQNYKFTIKSCTSLLVTLYLLLQCYKLEKLVKGVKHNCCCKTIRVCNRRYVLLEARRSLCPNTQKNKEKYGGKPDERLLPMKSNLSVSVPKPSWSQGQCKTRGFEPCADLFENKSLVPTFGEIH